MSRDKIIAVVALALVAFAVWPRKSAVAKKPYDVPSVAFELDGWMYFVEHDVHGDVLYYREVQATGDRKIELTRAEYLAAFERWNA